MTIKGKWTPSLIGLSGGVATLSVASGSYTRSGGIVCASARIVTSDVSSVSGQLAICGFPIDADQDPDASGRASASIAFWNGLSLPSGSIGVSGFMQEATKVRLYRQTMTGSQTLTSSHINGVLTLYITVTYQCYKPTSLQNIEWKRSLAPCFTPDGSANFDGSRVFFPVPTRNADYSPWLDCDGNLHCYYIATSVEDRSGLALGPDLDSLVRHSSTPVLDLGPPGAPDHGDAQITSSYRDELGGFGFYQGNSNGSGSGGDDVVVCRFLTSDGKTLVKDGAILPRSATGGDALDQYAASYVPVGHDGKPKLLLTGQDLTSVRGIVAATFPDGNPRGTPVRISDNHLYTFGSTFLGDAQYWGGLYHLLISPLDGVHGVVYVTTPDLTPGSFVCRGEIVPRNLGEWDANPFNCKLLPVGGIKRLLFNSSSNIGIGYYSAAS